MLDPSTSFNLIKEFSVSLNVHSSPYNKCVHCVITFFAMNNTALIRLPHLYEDLFIDQLCAALCLSHSSLTKQRQRKYTDDEGATSITETLPNSMRPQASNLLIRASISISEVFLSSLVLQSSEVTLCTTSCSRPSM